MSLLLLGEHRPPIIGSIDTFQEWAAIVIVVAPILISVLIVIFMWIGNRAALIRAALAARSSAQNVEHAARLVTTATQTVEEIRTIVNEQRSIVSAEILSLRAEILAVKELLLRLHPPRMAS